MVGLHKLEAVAESESAFRLAELRSLRARELELPTDESAMIDDCLRLCTAGDRAFLAMIPFGNSHRACGYCLPTTPLEVYIVPGARSRISSEEVVQLYRKQRPEP